jgi:hypothetical protein
VTKESSPYQGQKHGLSFWFTDRETFGGTSFGHASTPGEGFGIFVEDSQIYSINAVENTEGEDPMTDRCTIETQPDNTATKYFLKVHYSELYVLL